MTPEQQRIAIAEACPALFRISKESGDIIWKRGGMEQDCDLLTDLNAMDCAVRTLPYKQQRQFLYCLGDALGTPNRNDWNLLEMVNASAVLRAEAFLRTIGKWKD